MYRQRMRIFVVCGMILVTACGGGGVVLPPTPTTIPPTATPVPTATASPLPSTPTPIPTAIPTLLPPTETPTSRITAASQSATPSSGPGGREPFGSAPAGWKTYSGNARLPFAVYYPPTWTVDESEIATKGQVRFVSPTKSPSLWIHVDTSRTTTSIDTLRDSQAKALAASCVRSGVELTKQGVVSGAVFDELVVSCDLADQGQLSVFLVGVGLNNGFAWDITTYSPRKDFNRNSCGCPAGNVELFFDPMLNSAHIYGDPVG
jgi:hypothetical protein